jgi:hypothetical protein
MSGTRYSISAMAAFMAAIFVCAQLASAAAQPAKRSGVGPCRQAALSLMSMLDDKEDNTAAYRQAYEGIVQTCGPVAAAAPEAPSGREQCGKLALAMLDAIEEGKINGQGFVRARTRFALSCAPR